MCGMSCSDGVVAGHQYSVGKAEAKAGTESDRLLRQRNRSTSCISASSIAEIRFGIELQEDVTRRAELNDWLTLTLRPAFAGRILPVTEDILLKWRLLMEDGRKTGHTYSHPDLVLAATALHHGLTVVTRDRSDFDKARVPVFNPWEVAKCEAQKGRASRGVDGRRRSKTRPQKLGDIFPALTLPTVPANRRQPESRPRC
jgi:predicted nucleic acid-binding protein